MDYSFLQPLMNELLMKLLIVLGIPLVIALILKFLLVKVRMPNLLAGYMAGLFFLYFAYRLFTNVIQ